MKTESRKALRMGAIALLSTLAGSAGIFSSVPVPSPPSHAERIEALLALEQVRYNHQEWPESNTEPKPPLAELFSREEAARRVDSHLRMGSALRNLWREEITPEEIQAEMDRMARSSKLPDRLQEYWAALGNDPLTFAEVLVRPLLTEQRLRERYAWDRDLHASLRDKAEAEVARARATGAFGPLSGVRSQCRYLTADRLQGRSPEEGEMLLGVEEWQALRQRFTFSEAPRLGSRLGALQESEDSFYAQAATEVAKGCLDVTTYSWSKRPFDAWWEEVQQGYPKSLAPAVAYLLPEIPYQPENAHENWTAINNTPAVAPSARRKHLAVWTGSDMVIWGGEDFSGIKLKDGKRYDPALDSWNAMASAPMGMTARTQYRSGVWTGTTFIVWGETSDTTGGRYSPLANSWSTLPPSNAPSARTGHTAVWGFGRMMVWGGSYTTSAGDSNEGKDFNLTVWENQPATGTLARRRHCAGYDSTIAGVGGVVLWGGSSGLSNGMNSGATYSNGGGWSALSLSGAPVGRENATGLWRQGQYFLVWGGNNGTTVFNDGGKWAPADTWTSITTTGAPSPRTYHTALWASGQSAMAVWGGQNFAATPLFFNDGALYNGTSWSAMSTANAPSARSYHSAVYANGTNSGVMLVWGGTNATAVTNTGGAYHFCKATAVPATAAAITATDLSACAATGVSVTWPQDPSGGWGDDGFGPRSYTVLRSGTSVTTLAYPGSTAVDVGGTPDTAYTYAVRYTNGCGHTADAPAASATDSTDTTACGRVGDNLVVTKVAPDASLSWTAASCGDLKGYKVYGATSFTPAGTFPTGWTLLSSPTAATGTDPLASVYQAFLVVSEDTCGNLSGP